MSRRIRKNKSFLELLLNTEKRQALVLLDTVTKEQAQLIVEIAYNPLHKIALSKQSKQTVKKAKKLFNRLTNARVNISKKIKLIARHKYQLLKTLQFFNAMFKRVLS